MPEMTPSAPPAWRRRLTMPAYRVNDAARYAGTSTQTVNYWYFGGGGLGPALGGRKRGTSLHYMQLVELAFVATYRKLGVSLQRLRKARGFVATQMHSEWPFAEHEFQTDGLGIYMEFAEYEPEPETDALVAVDLDGQLAWAETIRERFDQFTYEDGTALIWRPSKQTPLVTIDGRTSFGAPSIKGVPTWVLTGRLEAGETVPEIADDFGLEAPEVEEGLEFERLELVA